MAEFYLRLKKDINLLFFAGGWWQILARQDGGGDGMIEQSPALFPGQHGSQKTEFGVYFRGINTNFRRFTHEAGGLRRLGRTGIRPALRGSGDLPRN